MKNFRNFVNKVKANMNLAAIKLNGKLKDSKGDSNLTSNVIMIIIVIVIAVVILFPQLRDLFTNAFKGVSEKTNSILNYN